MSKISIDSVIPGIHGYCQVGSDRYPITVMRTSKNRRFVWARFENFVAAPGHDYHGNQKWKITPNPKVDPVKFCWTPSRGAYCGDGGVLYDGGWDAYQDPCF